MIHDGIDYGEGHEKATEPGPGVERLAYYANGPLWIPRSNRDNFEMEVKYRQPIKPKEKSMSEKIKVTATSPMGEGFQVYLTLAEAEKAGEVAKKMREDMEIKTGDFVMYRKEGRRVLSVDRDCLHVANGNPICFSDCTKITNPAHIQALTEIYEGMK